MGLYVCIMAGGLGKRMKSTLPKVLHNIGDTPMLVLVIRQALPLNPIKILIIVGEYRKIIQETMESFFSHADLNKIDYIIQPVALGTGHAMQCTIPYFNDQQEVLTSSYTLILSGDVPLLGTDTINEFISMTNEDTSTTVDAVLMTQMLENPFGKGRVFIDRDEGFEKIVEEKDCAVEEALVKLTNCGIYLFKTDLMCKYLPELQNNNKQHEYYLTDLPAIMKNVGKHIKVWLLPESKEHEMMNINDQLELAKANQYYLQTKTMQRKVISEATPH